MRVERKSRGLSAWQQVTLRVETALASCGRTGRAKRLANDRRVHIRSVQRNIEQLTPEGHEHRGWPSQVIGAIHRRQNQDKISLIGPSPSSTKWNVRPKT